jgi:nucleoside 2-deoxyribosyltransferase
VLPTRRTQLLPVSTAIKAGIERAGYEPIRVDEEHYTGGVVDRILARIQESRFVVADFTRNRGGVYYEAGFASGLGIPVIHLCEQEQLDSEEARKVGAEPQPFYKCAANSASMRDQARSACISS